MDLKFYDKTQGSIKENTNINNRVYLWSFTEYFVSVPRYLKGNNSHISNIFRVISRNVSIIQTILYLLYKKIYKMNKVNVLVTVFRIIFRRSSSMFFSVSVSRVSRKMVKNFFAVV